jgi:hypothetical protein
MIVKEREGQVVVVAKENITGVKKQKDSMSWE